MSEQEQQAASEGIVGQSASTGGLGAWLPIETAPKNGRMLVATLAGIVTAEDARFVQSMISAARLDGEECFFTYWQPLPEAPNVQVEGAAGGLPPEAPARTQGSA